MVSDRRGPRRCRLGKAARAQWPGSWPGPEAGPAHGAGRVNEAESRAAIPLRRRRGRSDGGPPRRGRRGGRAPVRLTTACDPSPGRTGARAPQGRGPCPVPGPGALSCAACPWIVNSLRWSEWRGARGARGWGGVREPVSASSLCARSHRLRRRRANRADPSPRAEPPHSLRHRRSSECAVAEGAGRDGRGPASGHPTAGMKRRPWLSGASEPWPRRPAVAVGEPRLGRRCAGAGLAGLCGCRCLQRGLRAAVSTRCGLRSFSVLAQERLTIQTVDDMQRLGLQGRRRELLKRIGLCCFAELAEILHRLAGDPDNKSVTLADKSEVAL